MKIGVVCEGPTDLPAVVAFFGDSLKNAGYFPTFEKLFPDPDRTRANGGWGNLFSWLKNHPPATRISRYFGGGLFANFETYQRVDAILFQVDADIIDDDGFRTFANREFGVEIQLAVNPDERARAIREVIELAADAETLTLADKARHVFAVAVESTETWCLAAFNPKPSELEVLRGSELRDEFMKALERSEGREPRESYAECDKNANRRLKYCERFERFSSRVAASCPHFEIPAAQLQRVALGLNS